MFMKRIIRRVVLLACVTAALVLHPGVSLADTNGKPTSIGGIDQPGGTIKGVIKFQGKQITRKPIKIKSDKYCKAKHGSSNPLLNERWVFGDNGSLQNVFIWVSKGLEGKSIAVPTEPAVLDQRGCQYSPHVLGVVVGQPLNIVNSDGTLHNVNARPKRNRGFNEGMPLKGMVMTKKFTKPEKAIHFKCDVHGWMSAYLHVVEHPFFAVSGPDGTFEIKGLPPGEYELSVWHEFSRFKPDQSSIKVTVSEGQTAAVTFTFGPKKKK